MPPRQEAKRAKHSVALWGNADFGRLGHGNHKATEEPAICEALEEYSIKQVACGGAHSIVLTDDGQVFTMGLNERGQLGIRGKEASKNVPTRVDGFDSAIVHVSAGHHHTVCIDVDGGVWSFGDNTSGQLGLGTSSDRTQWTPAKVGGLGEAKVVQAACGAEHTLAVTDSGEVLTWGSRANGRLGHGQETHLLKQWMGSEAAPRLLRSLKGKAIRSVSAGHMHSACIDENGVLFSWGHGRFWQLGTGFEQDVHIPAAVPVVFRTAGVAGGGAHTAAVSSNGDVFVWGANQEGCLGLGEEMHAFSRAPARVDALERHSVAQVACGWKHTAARTEGGLLFTWGWGGAMGAYVGEGGSGGGQLGLGNDFDYLVPHQVKLGALEDPEVRVIQIACGFQHTAAIIARR